MADSDSETEYEHYCTKCKKVFDISEVENHKKYHRKLREQKKKEKERKGKKRPASPAPSGQTNVTGSIFEQRPIIRPFIPEPNVTTDTEPEGTPRRPGPSSKARPRSGGQRGSPNRKNRRQNQTSAAERKHEATRNYEETERRMEEDEQQRIFNGG